MLRFWRNPEFIRYRRAELRPARAAAAGSVALVVCLLVFMSCWGATSNPKAIINLDEFYSYSYSWLTTIEGVILALWSISACGAALSSERQLKTFDFLRTTRLTAGELLVGKLMGAPVLAYFAIGITLPLSVVMGVLAGRRWHTLLATYLLMLVFTLFSGLVGLWISMQVEKSGVGAGLLAFFLLWLGSQGVMGLAHTAFPGFAAILPLPAVVEMYAERPGQIPPAMFFGQAVPYVVLSLFLYVTLGAWFALMIVRNLKRDVDEIQLLSRRQAVLLVAFLNLLLYAFFNPGAPAFATGSLEMTALALNAALLLAVGVATLSPAERLRVWWRQRGEGGPHYFSDNAPNWPWLVLSTAIAFGMLMVGALAWYGEAGLRGWQIAAVQWLTLLVFLVRDVCFLQWCKLTRMRQAVAKGLLFLALYYIAAAIISLTVSEGVSENAGRILRSLLAPWTAFDVKNGQILWAVYLGVVIHAALTVVVLRAIHARIARVPERKASAAAA